jgi:hypothetical protein
MRLPLLLALTLSAGCTGPSETFFVDENFTPEEQAQIQYAADLWQDKVTLVFNQRVSAFEKNVRVVVKVDTATLLQASEGARENPHVTAALVGGNAILIHPVGKAPMWYRAAHEFGHGLGIVGHVDDESALMHWKLTEHSLGCVTTADAARYLVETGDTVAVGCP